MCTLTIATAVDEDTGLFAIVNRDEVLDRPASDPQLFRREDRRILAPRDEQAGGTWLGVNDCGLFAAITNRFGCDTQPHHRSRGLLVFDTLECAKIGEAVERLRSVSPNRYNGFHLVVADEREAYVAVNDTAEVRLHRLDPGFHVVTERSWEAGPSDRIERMRGRLEQLEPPLTDSVRATLRGWMAEHREDDPLESTCVHLPERHYATRSSTIVELGARWRLAHAAGPPCTADYREHTDAINQLRVA